RLANSAYMRGGGEVDSLHDAALRIGSRSLRQLIFSMRLINAANSLAPGFDWTHLWKHNFATSVLAVDLQTIFGMESHFTGGIGLIHDLGKVILSDLYPAEYAAIVQRAYDHRSAMGEEEQRVFGISHEEVGAQYVVHYGFAREIQEALLYQNTPAEAPTHRAAAALLQLANYFAKLHGLGYSGDRRYLDQEYDQLPGWRVLLEEAGADQKLMIERYENYLRSSLRSSLAKARHQVDAMFGR
ncbi:MAG: HDOD domain-containing protein, partial [Verrucomicrobiota bacterium]